MGRPLRHSRRPRQARRNPLKRYVVIYDWMGKRPSWDLENSQALIQKCVNWNHGLGMNYPGSEGIQLDAESPVEALWEAMRRLGKATIGWAERQTKRKNEPCTWDAVVKESLWRPAADTVLFAYEEGEIVVVEIDKTFQVTKTDKDVPFTICLWTRPVLSEDDPWVQRRPRTEAQGMNEELFEEAAELYREEMARAWFVRGLSHPDQWRGQFPRMSDEEIREVYPEARPLFDAEAGGTLWAENNPRARTNPLKKPTSTTALAVTTRDPNYVCVVLYDTVTMHLMGWGELQRYEGDWATVVMGAAKQYGPLLYDVCARVVNARIGPSAERLPDAERFWSHQGDSSAPAMGKWILPLTDVDFKAKYGTAFAVLGYRDVGLTPAQVKTYATMADSVIFAGSHREHVPFPYDVPKRKLKLQLRKKSAKAHRNPYRSAVISMPTSAQLLGNPSKIDPYDPWEESLRAQRQAVYESAVRRELKLKSNAPFRYEGQRLDTILLETLGLAELRELIRINMFAKGTRALQRADRQAEGQATHAARMASYERYRDPLHLLANRQDYEETLGLARLGGFYRVTQEPTKAGMKYFVWPLPPRIQTPQPMTLAQAQRLAADLNNTQSPLDTGRWWRPGRGVTARSLEAWLPPISFWTGE